MEETKLTFPKANKLKSSVAIQELFEKGLYIQVENIKILYLPNQNNTHQLAFTVPKRNFKLATDRNLIKRQMRESYRVNQLIINNLSIKQNIIFIYLSKNQSDFHKLHQNIKNILSQLALQIE